ncbi:MAG: hypothetical protein AWM53_00716 [Candidatus Dichloromethanomonas elyunquensis]|nr:MAG: hypothetical protein AWM53_00716 [Candidatus Dichloromethanomonas elyunquensis]
MSNNCEGLIEEKLKCSCRGYNLDKLLQPSILIILAKQKLHGYLIVQELENRNLLHGEKADTAGIYRTLATLENKGRVQFEWDLQGTGPAKKTYKITESGLECLSNWIQTLQDYRKTIDLIIEEAKTTFIE